MPIVVAVAVPVAVLFRPACRTSDFFPEVDFGPTPAEQTAVNGKVCEEVRSSGMLGDAVPKGRARRRRQGGARADPVRALKCVSRTS